MKLFSLHGRQRCRCHVSAELLPCNRAAAAGSAAASKGERMPRLSASEPVPPCKALGDEGNPLPRQGRQHRAPCWAGSAAGLASKSGRERILQQAEEGAPGAPLGKGHRDAPPPRSSEEHL